MIPRHIFLIGPMGAGKTAVGKRLARALELPFFDTDHALQERTGVDISFIFEKEGESGFRKREARMLKDLANESSSVIATGGGIVELDENVELLKSSRETVFLDASVEWQFERTRKGMHRPLLENPDPLAVLEALYTRRRPRYEACASIVVSTDSRHVRDVSEEVFRRLGALEASQ